MNSDAQVNAVIQAALQDHKAGNDQAALSALRKARKKARKHAGLYDAEISILIPKGELDDALELANERLKIKKDKSGFRNKGKCLELLERFQQAADCYALALRQEVDKDTAQRFLFSKMKVDAYESIDEVWRDHEKVKSHISKSELFGIAVNSNNDRWINELAFTRECLDRSDPFLYREHALVFLRNNRPGALQLIEECYEMAPWEVGAVGIYASALRVVGELEKSKSILMKAWNDFPEHGQLSLYIRVFLISIGAFEEAEKYFNLNAGCELLDQLPKLGVPYANPESIDEINEDYIVHMEEGVGDQIRNFAFVLKAYELGYRFTLSCQPRMAKFFRQFCPDLKYRTEAKPGPDDKEKQMIISYQLLVLLARKIGYASALEWCPQRRRLTDFSLAGDADGRKRVGITLKSAVKQRWRRYWYPSAEVFSACLEGYDVDIYVMDDTVSDDDRAALASRGHRVITAGDLGIDAKNDFCTMHDLLQEMTFCLIPPVSLMYQAPFAGVDTIFLATEGFERWQVSEPFLHALYPELTYIRCLPDERWEDKIAIVRGAIARRLG